MGKLEDVTARLGKVPVPRFPFPESEYSGASHMDEELADLAGTRRARLLLGQAETAMLDVLAALDELREQLLKGELKALSDINATRGTLAKVRSQLMDEVKKHEERCAFDGGLVAAAPLDFDRLRADLGRKLDRLRDAGGTEGVS